MKLSEFAFVALAACLFAACLQKETDVAVTSTTRVDSSQVVKQEVATSSPSRIQPPSSKEEQGEVGLRALAKAPRFALPAEIRRMWSREGSMTDDLLMQPADLFAFGNTLLLSDFSGSRIVALELKSGNSLWKFGRVGDGPGEFRGRIGIVGRMQDTVFLWNHQTRTLTKVSSSGTLVGTIRVIAPAMATSLCVLGDGTIIGNKFVRQDAAMIATISPDGKELVRLDSLPWREIQHLPPMAAQFTLHSLQDGVCLLAASYWSGAVAIVARSRIRDSVQLVERVPLPSAWLKEVTVQPGVDRRTGPAPRRGVSSRLSDSTVSSTADVAELAEHVIFAFDGASPEKGRLLDFYNKRTGDYAGSLQTADRIRHIAGSGDILVVITESNIGLYEMNAYRIRMAHSELPAERTSNSRAIHHR